MTEFHSGFPTRRSGTKTKLLHRNQSNAKSPIEDEALAFATAKTGAKPVLARVAQ